MTTRNRGLTTYLLVTLILAMLGLAAFKACSSPSQANSGALQPAHDPLDPNDCSRGVDEANESECLGGGQ